MKFRDPKTGEVFDDIETVHSRFCGSSNSGKRCQECPLGIDRTGHACVSFRNAHPAEAALLMGYEVMEDDATVKPLSKWTLGEVRAYCAKQRRTRDFCSGCAIATQCDRYFGRGGESTAPEYWDLDDKPRFMEAIMGDQERRFVMNNIAKPATGETQDEKPRICEVLGVEVGERFAIDDESRWWYLCRNEQRQGELSFASDGWRHTTEDENRLLRIIIERPDRIIRKPRFTEEEVAVLRYIDGAQKIKKVHRNECGTLEILFETEGRWAFPTDMFPSLRPGQSIELSEAIP